MCYPKVSFWRWCTCHSKYSICRHPNNNTSEIKIQYYFQVKITYSYIGDLKMGSSGFEAYCTRCFIRMASFLRSTCNCAIGSDPYKFSWRAVHIHRLFFGGGSRVRVCAHSRGPQWHVHVKSARSSSGTENAGRTRFGPFTYPVRFLLRFSTSNIRMSRMRSRLKIVKEERG